MNSPSVDQTPEQPPMRGVGSSESSALAAYIVQTALGFTYYSGSRLDCAEEMIRSAGITADEIRKYGGEHAQRLLALLPNTHAETGPRQDAAPNRPIA